MAVVDPIESVLTQDSAAYEVAAGTLESRVVVGGPASILIGIPASYEAAPPVADRYWIQVATQPVYTVGASNAQGWSEEVERRERDLQRAKRYVASLLGDTWQSANAHRSSLSSATEHPAFRSLVALGTAGTSEALRRLNGRRRPLWIYFLNSTVAARPAAGTDTIDDAARAWRGWGRAHGFIP